MLHIGRDTLVFDEDVLAILDLSSDPDGVNIGFLSDLPEKPCALSGDKRKSAVICSANGETTLYYSPIAAQTLLKRSRKKGGRLER